MPHQMTAELLLSRKGAVEFVFIAEAGELERQGWLLAESVRQFGGRFAGAAITVLQPRGSRAISPVGRTRLTELGVRIVEMEIVSPCPEYGTSYRVLAAAEYERASQAEVMVLLDTDMLVLAEPDLDLQGAQVAARPVDVQGMATRGGDDANDVYWRALCEVCGVDYEAIPWVTSTVDRVELKASYNGGLTLVNPRAGLFQRTADFFRRSTAAGLVPWPDWKMPFPAGHGTVSAEGGRLWGSAQACLSLAITALGLRVRVLPASMNFPLHSYAECHEGVHPEVTLVHYHHVLRDHPFDNPILAGAPGFPGAAVPWLRERVARLGGGERLVIVLGMHRSGTSALTKGLEVLGIDLGTEFHPATADNPTGFWEDRGFHDLHEEMLAALAHPWDDLRLLRPEAVRALAEGPFFARARELVQRSLRRNALAGVKDPRFALLWPFWQRVFEENAMNVRVILAVRHPLSVARSLAARDGFPTAKALWLWVIYNLGALSAAGEGGLIVVDYDALLDDPAGQLTRLAGKLELALDHAALAVYSAEFLDPVLRHARSSESELREHPAADSLVLAMYESLVAQEGVGSLALAAAWQQSLAAFGPVLGLAAQFDAANQQLTRALAAQTARAHYLQTQAAQLSEGEARILALEAKIERLAARAPAMSAGEVGPPARVRKLEEELSEEQAMNVRREETWWWKITAPGRLLWSKIGKGSAK